MTKFERLDTVAGIIVAIAVFLVYILTLAPTIGFNDSGELATVAATLGIAHPTGYPLFTLIGWIFTKIPIGGSEAYRVNLMAAVFCAAGIFVFFKVLLLILGQFYEQKSQQYERFYLIIAASFGALVLAFSQTYWSQAVSVEVYSLHCLLIISIIYIFLRALFSPNKKGAERNWLLLGLLFGLSFSNHMSTIMLAPAFLYLYFAEQGIRRDSFKRILYMLVPFLIGLSLYLYLPIRASYNPPLNWGNPTTLESFIWHLSGRVYQARMFISGEVAFKQLSHLIGTLPGGFMYFPLLFAIAGVVELFRWQRRVFYFSFLLITACIVMAINYDIHDIDSYFLLAYIIVALWSGAGVVQVFMWITMSGVRKVFAVGVVLSALIVLVSNYSEADESRNYIPEDYTMNMFSSVQPDAIILTSQWDYFSSPALYFQLVRNVRRDVVIIEPYALAWSWYITVHLRTHHPWLVDSSQKEIDALLKEVYKREHDLPFDKNVIQARIKDVIDSFIDRHIDQRPVYVTYEFERMKGSKYVAVPEGLAFRLYRDEVYHEMNPLDFKFRDVRKTNPWVRWTKQMYPIMLTRRGIYEAQYGKTQKAWANFDKALKFDPDFPEAKQWKERLQQPYE